MLEAKKAIIVSIVTEFIVTYHHYSHIESHRKLNRQRVMKLLLYCEYLTWDN